MGIFKILLLTFAVLMASETRAQTYYQDIDMIDAGEKERSTDFYKRLYLEFKEKMRAKPDYCKKWQDGDFPIDELVKKLKNTTMAEVQPCFPNHLFDRNLQYHRRVILEGLLNTKGLPAKIRRKMKKLMTKEVRVYLVTAPLCLLQEACNEESELVAKNYRFKDVQQGFIFINGFQWLKLSKSERFSIMLHEVLSVLGFETNSYEISSMIQIEERCEDRTTPTSWGRYCGEWIMTWDKDRYPIDR